VKTGEGLDPGKRQLRLLQEPELSANFIQAPSGTWIDDRFEGHTEECLMALVVQTATRSKAQIWIGRTLSVFVVLFMVFDAATKLIKTPQDLEATARLGYPERLIVPIAIIALVCTTLYSIPRTSILGAILLTAYLGGAVASQVRAGSPFFSEALFPVYVGLLVWLGLYLRDDRLRVLVPLQS
jgi:hypothetical protein